MHADYKNETKLREALSLLEKKAFKQAEALLCVLQLSNKDHAKDVPQWIKTEVTKKADASAVSALTKKGY